MGRKSTYTQEIADLVCERMAEGESLRAVCSANGLSIGTVLGWCKQFPEFAEQYALAMETRAHVMVDEMRDIAQSVEIIKKRRPGAEDDEEPTEVAVDGASVARARLEIDVIKWQTSKMLPKIYGDRQHIEHSGQIDAAAAIVAARKRSGGSGDQS